MVPRTVCRKSSVAHLSVDVLCVPSERCTPARSLLSAINHGTRWEDLRLCFRQGVRFRLRLRNSALQGREDVAGGVFAGARVVQRAAGDLPGRREADVVLELEKGE